MRFTVINGPNLNLLGTRQPEVYGTETLDDLQRQVDRWAESLGVEVTHFQSNDESDLVTAIQQAGEVSDGIVVNPGGFSHTSVAIADAVASVTPPVVEVHISDISKREAFRQISLVAPAAVTQIKGRGIVGYRDAMRHLINRSRTPFDVVRYGPDASNVGDHRAHGGSSALIVLVHGGFWFPQWGRDQLDSAAIDLYERGHDTLNVAYRLSPPWPGSGHDILSAVLWAKARYDRVALLGHSAGGYLALWSHARQPVDLAVGLAAITDLRLVEDVETVGQILGAGGPRTLRATSDTILFHGDDDAEVSLEHTTDASEFADVQVLNGVGHFDLINPRRAHWEQIAAQFERVK